jgi:predicted DNA-binding transcriptional regulator AlpA
MGKAMAKTAKDDDSILKELDDYPPVLKPAEVQAILRISRATFFRWIESDQLPGAVKVAGSWRVLRNSLKQWLIDQST